MTGATSGIGAACAKKLAQCGAKVALIGRSTEKGLQITGEIASTGGNAAFFPCDISDEGSVKECVMAIVAQYGRINILINNAGIMLPSMEIERMPVDEWRQTFNTNVTGYFLMTRYVKTYLMESRGVIVNNASIAGLQHYAVGRSYAYSASKAAVIQFSHQMAKNYGEDGIRVNCICPGIIDTPILGDRDRKLYAERIPLGYVGKPDDVAKVVAFLVSDEASYLTGVVLPIDGGASL